MDFKPEKKLGFGLMRLPLKDPADASSVDTDQVCKMVDTFLEKGFTEKLKDDLKQKAIDEAKKKIQATINT